MALIEQKILVPGRPYFIYSPLLKTERNVLCSLAEHMLTFADQKSLPNTCYFLEQTAFC
jgi:hypothetical protein